MTTRFACAFALAVSMTAAPALAETTSFRTAEPAAFSQVEAERYGLTDAQVAQIEAYEREGRLVRVMTAEESASYRGGQYASDTMWIVLGAIVLVVLVAAAVD